MYALSTSLQLTNMKHIIKLSNNRYVHLDSYGEYNKLSSASVDSEHFKFLMTIFVLFIAATTAGAMVGIDITNINPSNNQEKSK